MEAAMSTLKQVHEALGQDKLTVLAVAIDQLRAHLYEREHEADIDEQIETVDVALLAEQNGVSPKVMRERICSKLGQPVVIRLGRRFVIRKTRFLEFLRACESENA